MRNPEFEASIAEAKLYPEFWRILLGLLLIVFIYAASTALIFGVTAAAIAQTNPFGIMPFFNGLAEPDDPVEVIVLLLTFFGMFLGVILAAAALHFRGPGSLFGTFSEWIRGFFTGLLVLWVIFGAVLMIGILFDPPEPNLPFQNFLRWLPLALPLLFLQIGAEELLFRGYLQQQLAARFHARWIWFWIPSVLFAFAHFDPSMGPNVALVLLSTLTFALIAADLTERTGSLGAAMGLHFANNFLGLFIVSFKGTITGLALYVTEAPVETVGFQSVGMAFGILVLLLVWWVTRRILVG
ncbi:CPBP family intramembrane glutamic endopeptidase [Actibacterium sp. 188UL27-1]|uniref:CPBP family intramembrane glutamic endopeptidase n=1 Tax=Actibacterium sp. 188UL27-1 TaxID=2786961 RepID=UPI00195B8C3A|nr:type II CAAX endopeptidase family protein [Actibacterium sp. 188UL27-1]MBM7069521.1 CPBP family intramembrane metalloprotease [Actibacterium sp. 188UL27-1]